MRILVINGPNLNLLGVREPAIYGSGSYAALCERIENHCREKGVEVSFFQSNHEGALVDRIQAAYSDGTDGIVINPAAYRAVGCGEGGRAADGGGAHFRRGAARGF